MNRPLSLTIVVASVVALRSTSSMPQAIPVREFAPTTVKTVEPLDLIFGLKQMPDGRVLVNDAGHMRLLVFDSTLASFTVLADSSGAPAMYGRAPAQLIPYVGDSALFVDNVGNALLLIGPTAKIQRSMALPKASDLIVINASRVGVDPQGSLIYRGRSPVSRPRPVPGSPSTMEVRLPDSASLVRANFERRSLDTLIRVKMPATLTVYTTPTSDGQLSSRAVVYPLSSVDDWDVCPDGTVAVVRGHDYHIDWLQSDGTLTSTPRLPFDWLRITDDEKQRIADSARSAVEARIRPPGTKTPSTIRPDGTRVRYATGLGNRIDGTSGAIIPLDAVVEAAPGDIPDYYPPIRAGSVKADLDGNIWILPTTSAHAHGGRVIYDIVNRHGELFERVQPPEGRSIAGFGPGGVVYLMWRDSTKVWHLEKSRVKR